MNLGPSDEQIFSAVQNGRIRPLSLDLYAFTDGYKVTVPGKNCVDCVTQPFKYDRDYEFLEFIQNGEIPYVLTDLFERFCPAKLFYCGCMVVHIRKHWILDAKGLSDEATFWKVLRPSVLSLLHDFNAILKQAHSKGLSEKELNELESQFWRLSTSHKHFAGKNRVQDLLPPRVPFYQNRDDEKCIDILKNCRKRKQEIETAQITTFRASGFLDNQLSMSTENRYEPRISWFRKTRDLSPSSWKPMLPSAKCPFDILEKKNLLNDENNATNSSKNDDFTIPVEEYDLEFKNSNTNTIDAISQPLLNAKNPRTKIQIDKRSTDWTHRGRLILDRGLQDRPQIVEANFPLGAASLSKSYVVQYVDMVTEGGRKAANLTRTLPGKQAQVLNIRGWGK